MGRSVFVSFVLVGCIRGVRESGVFLDVVFLKLSGRCNTVEDVL